MDSLLYHLYTGNYDFTPKPDKAQRELEQKLFTEWERIQEELGLEFVDRMFQLEAEREDIREFLAFREGFRLGIRLALEGVTPA